MITDARITDQSTSSSSSNHSTRVGEATSTDVWASNIWSRLARYCLDYHGSPYLRQKYESRHRPEDIDRGAEDCKHEPEGVVCSSKNNDRDVGSQSNKSGEQGMIREQLAQRFALYGSVFINLLLVVFIGIQLRVTPSQVLEEVKTQASSIIQDSTDIRNDLASIKDEMYKRKEWMNTTDGVVSKLAGEALQKQEFILWCKKAKEINPNLVLPEIGDN